MSDIGPVDSPRPPPSVFLSYASEDRLAAHAIRDALPAFGLEVWYDESGLDGGDAWDQKIRRQIRECDFFMPLISAQTAARPEGYFRREWRLAVERTLDMADDHTFLLPVVIDDITQAAARVPEKFLSVQWLRVPGGRPTAALEALCRRLASGQPVALQPARKTADQRAAARLQPGAREYPQFPREEPGQKVRFWVQVVGWGFQSSWRLFQRFPRWVRIVVYIWVSIALLSRGCMPSHEHSESISSADVKKLKEISENYQGSLNKADIAKLGAQIAREFTDGAGGKPGEAHPLLAIPFSAPSGDPVAQKLADSTFAQVYGRIALSHHGRVGLTDEPLSSPDSPAAVEQGRAHHAKYVLYGAVDEQSAAHSLTVRMIVVADGSILWSGSYPVAGADPAKIAAEVDSKVPRIEGD
jgi:TolB-like protein